MFKKYFIYLDDGTYCSKVAVPAESEEKAREFVYGNGEVIAVKDVTKDVVIDSDRVFGALMAAKFNEHEIDFICRALREVKITE